MFLKHATHICICWQVSISIYLCKTGYYCIIHTFYLYCCIIWGSCYSVSEDKLITFQKRSARIILDKDYITPSTKLLTELNWTTFPGRVLYQKVIAMYKIENNICPDYHKNHKAYTSEFNSRDTRSSISVQFYIPKPNSELFRRSFMYSVVVIWNGLPYDVNAAISANSFKSRYLKWRQLRNWYQLHFCWTKQEV